jgi:hypothetical protein
MPACLLSVNPPASCPSLERTPAAAARILTTRRQSKGTLKALKKATEAPPRPPKGRAGLPACCVPAEPAATKQWAFGSPNNSAQQAAAISADCGGLCVVLKLAWANGRAAAAAADGGASRVRVQGKPQSSACFWNGKVGACSCFWQWWVRHRRWAGGWGQAEDTRQIIIKSGGGV